MAGEVVWQERWYESNYSHKRSLGDIKYTIKT